MQTFEEAYTKLNPEQKRAVDTIEGPVLVIAGPGTGKTQILTLRIANILAQADVRPSNILALTFTENAAFNMQKRLASFIGKDAYLTKITTFHGFCNDLVQSFPEKFAFNRELIAMDELGAYRIFCKLLEEFEVKGIYDQFETKFPEEVFRKLKLPMIKPFGAPLHYVPEIIRTIDNLKREYVSPEKYEEFIHRELDNFNEEIDSKKKLTKKTQDTYSQIAKNIELLEIFKQYQKELKEHGRYDFNDMTGFVAQKLATDDDLLAQMQEQYLYILIDEYQDTNSSQNEITRLLGSFDESPNIFAVGDDDQSIFRFQGANLSNILSFTENYPSADIITITTNYRSTQIVLDAASSVIENNTNRITNKIEGISKDLKSAIKSQINEKIKVANFSRGEIEHFYIADQIKDLINNGVEPNEIAIIYRNHSDGEQLLDTLLKLEIPVNYSAASNILDEKIITKLIKLIQTIHDPGISPYLAEVLQYDFIRLNRIDAYKIIHAHKSKANLYESLLDTEYLNSLKIEGLGVMRVNWLGNKLFEWKQLFVNTTFIRAFERIINDSGLVPFLIENKDYDALNSVKSMFEFIKKRNREKTDYDLNELINDIAVMQSHQTNRLGIKKSELKTKAAGIAMYTAHSSKGLEFEYIFLPHVINKKWGNTIDRKLIKLVSIVKESDEKTVESESESKNEEARRLFFVALTRAKKHITITSANEYVNEASIKSAQPSIFINEINEKLIEKIDTTDYENQSERVLELELAALPELNFNEIEKDYLRSLIDEFRLSPSALNNYLNDPQRFLYENLLKGPTMSNRSLAIGNAIHSSLEQFYKSIKIEKLAPSIEQLNTMFKNYLAKQMLGSKDFDESLEEGQRLLSGWYQNKAGNFSEAAELEYGFFNKGIYINDVQLNGKLDKIEWIDKDQKTVRIIDYKSGSPKPKTHFAGDVAAPDRDHYRQLLFYKLLTDEYKYFPYIVEEVQIEYLKPQNGNYKSYSFNPTKEELDNMRELIRATIAKIKNLEF